MTKTNSKFGKFLISIILLSFVIIFDSTISEAKPVIHLPEPELKSDMSLEEAIVRRRSVRSFSNEALTLAEVSQLLWACQGITSPMGYHTVPSAGALYPLEIYMVVDRVEGLKSGIYHYKPGPGLKNHSLEYFGSGVNAGKLANAALNQDCIRDAAINIIITAVTSRTSAKYGERAERYILIEIGHSAQNICLQAQSLNLGVATVGALDDNDVKRLLSIKAQPFYILPVGRVAP
ncbi:MAG: SagB/ThcOx family dehydrogenase [Candidatus Electryonea clarkiae]|nr:SagB/ThcOx family dehydrogenase [Candidatus Electryonea clarkiae]MDP8288112.1 SagB/ThcOx family dehydrogenase [Candidatus Electryonea clarkiae]